MIGIDLQTDPDFPAWATEASPSALQAQEAMMRQNEVSEFLSRFSIEEITGRDGRSLQVLAQHGGIARTAVDPWGLLEVSARPVPRVRISPGKISRGFVYDSGIEIEGADKWLRVTNGDILHIKIDDRMRVSLEVSNRWKGWPHGAETALDADGLPSMVAFRYPLWEFTAFDPGGSSVTVAQGLWARRMAPPCHFCLSAWVIEGSEGRVVTSWVLLPAPGTVADKP